MRRTISILTAAAALSAAPTHAETFRKSCGRWLGLTSKTTDAEARAIEVAAGLETHQAALRTIAREAGLAFPPRDVTKFDHWNQPVSVEKYDITTTDAFKILERFLIKDEPAGHEAPKIPKSSQPVPPESKIPEQSDLVVVAVAGPANMGKSLIVNSMPRLANGFTEVDGKTLLTPTSRTAGHTKRALLVIPKGEGPAFDRRFKELKRRYPGMEPLTDPKQLITRNDNPNVIEPPLYTFVEGLENYPNLVFLDTPDLTTGDILKDDAPVNLQNAREALLAADFIMFVINEDNQKNYDLGKIIAKGFRLHGYRNAAFVLRHRLPLDAPPSPGEEPSEDPVDLLIKATRQFFGVKEGKDTELPSFVKALYGVEDEMAVHERKKLPEFSRLRSGPTLPALLAELTENALEIRATAVTEAGKALYEQIRDELDKVLVNHGASQIFETALALAMQVAPKPVKIPYDPLAVEWRRCFNERRRALDKAVDRSSEKLSGTKDRVLRRIKKTKVFRARLGLEVADPEVTFAQVLRDTDEQVYANWSARLTEILLEFRQGRVTLPTAAAETLLNKIAEINTQTPRAPFDTKPQTTSRGSITINLPPTGMLTEGAREALRKVLDTPVSDLLRTITTKVDEHQVAVLTDARVAEGVSEIQDVKYHWGSRTRDVLANTIVTTFGGALEVGSPVLAVGRLGGGYVKTLLTPALEFWRATPGIKFAAAAGTAASVGSDVATPTILSSVGLPIAFGGMGFGAGVLISSGGRELINGWIDKDLKPLVERWFTEAQKNLFANGLREQIFAPATTGLFADTPTERLSSVKKVYEALVTLRAIPADGAAQAIETSPTVGKE